MDSEEISTFWDFERKRYGSQNMPSTPKTLLLKDIYYEFLAPRLQKTRENWDNLADRRYYLDVNDTRHEDWKIGKVHDADSYTELQKKAHRSFEDCAALCESLSFDECFSYKFSDGVCTTGNAFQLGRPVKPEDEAEKRTTSGWDVKKIHAWIKDQGECDSIHWPDVSN